MAAKKPTDAAKKVEDWVAQTIANEVYAFVVTLQGQGIYMTANVADQLVDWICDRAKVVVE